MTRRGRRMLRFPGVTAPVALPPDLVPVLSACLRGWQPDILPEGSAALPPLARITRQRGQYRFTSGSLSEPMTRLTAVGAVCAMIADLAQARSEAPDMAMGLHCAALRIGGRLVVLTGPARTGKTTLAVRLALEPGVELFCDDVLPVRPDGQGMALGFAPRLRLPLPEAAGARLRDLTARRMGPSDHRYGYVDLPVQAPHGCCAPLGAIVMLDRGAGPGATLARLPDDTGVRLMLAQAITRTGSPEAALDQALRLVQGLPVLCLSYDSLDQAAETLHRALTDPAILRSLPLAEAPAPPAADHAPAPLDQVLGRAPDTARRTIAGVVFLWQPGEAEVWHLNPVADAIWALLEYPGTARDIAAALAEVFPQVPQAQLLEDTAALLGALHQAGLVAPVPEGPATPVAEPKENSVGRE